MSTSATYRKRELSPLRRACLSLGLPVDAKSKTNLSRQLRKAKLGNTAIEFLQISGDDQAQRIVSLYGLLNATERKAVTIDYLIMAAGADVHHVSGVIQEEVSRKCGIKMGILAYGVVFDALVKAALKPDGIKAQQILFKLCEPFWLASSELYEPLQKAITHGCKNQRNLTSRPGRSRAEARPSHPTLGAPRPQKRERRREGAVAGPRAARTK